MHSCSFWRWNKRLIPKNEFVQETSLWSGRKVGLVTSSSLNWIFTGFWSKSHRSPLYSSAIVLCLVWAWGLYVPEIREMGFLSHIIFGHCNPLWAASKIKSEEESLKVLANPFNKTCNKGKKKKKPKGSDREFVGSSGQSNVKQCLLFILHMLYMLIWHHSL